jgi:ketosteroid isomerase-like protein
MINSIKLIAFTAILVALAACARTASPNTEADQTAVRAVNVAWYRAYNHGDGAAVAALYADNAVLSAPGAPPARGGAAIRDFYLKDAGQFAASKLAEVDNPGSDIGISGDTAWQWITYKIRDKSGTTIDTGKSLTVFERRNGKWMIVRDIWNSDIVSDASTPAPPK